MSASDILAWHDFFAVLAQAGATLAGLLFVGLTISLEHVLQARGYLARAFAALFLQLEILLIGLFGPISAQPGNGRSESSWNRLRDGRCLCGHRNHLLPQFPRGRTIRRAGLEGALVGAARN